MANHSLPMALPTPEINEQPLTFSSSQRNASGSDSMRTVMAARLLCDLICHISKAGIIWCRSQCIAATARISTVTFSIPRYSHGLNPVSKLAAIGATGVAYRLDRVFRELKSLNKSYADQLRYLKRLEKRADQIESIIKKEVNRLDGRLNTAG